MRPYFECGSEAPSFDQVSRATNLNPSTAPAARPSHPATSANPPAATGLTPGPQATSLPSGISDNNSSRSTHTGSSVSSFRIAGKTTHTARERTSLPETPSHSPEIFRALPRATISSTNSASLVSPDTNDQSLRLPCVSSAKPAKAAPEKEFRPNTHCRSR